MDRRISDQIADEAGAWDARLRAPDCTDEDRARFAQWRDASPERREAFEKIQTIVTTFRSSMGRADVRGLRDAALATVERRRRGRAWTTAAAGLAALAIGATIWTTLPDRVRYAPFEKLASLTDTLRGSGAGIYETGIGQQSTIRLQDGSSVELNSKTRIRVAFTENARNVELLQGQAYFRVTKNPQRPFIVRAADRDITSLGTAFDVRIDAASVRVTLLEGKVRVTKDSYLEPVEWRGEMPSSLHAQPETPTQVEALPQTNDFYLSPGQQLVARLTSAPERGNAAPSSRAAGTAEPDTRIPTSNVVVRSIDVSKVIGWRDGRVFLEDLTLAEAVAEMNKYSELQIRVADPQLAEVRVNGMFRAGEQEGFVVALEEYFPISAQHEGEEIILTRE